MTRPEPTDVIAPRDDLPYTPVDFLREMFICAYPTGVILEYHGLRLHSHGFPEDGLSVWEVCTENDVFIESVNVSAFRSMTAFVEFLDEIGACDPDDREEWVNR